MFYQRKACPPMSQPFRQACNHGDPQLVYEGMFIEKVISILTPYMAYEFQVIPVNDAGQLDFPVWVRIETTPEVPRYLRYPVLEKNDSQAGVDWSGSFILNGRLLEYLIIMDDGNTVYRGVASIHGLGRPTPQANLIFTIRCVTESGTVESPKIVFDPRSTNNVGTTPSADGSTDSAVGEPLFFEEVWFIALMVVLGVLLLLILLTCCIRNCGKSNPYIRERLPLQDQQNKQQLSFITDSNERRLFAMYDSESLEAPSYSITKEQTVFTDTHL